MDLEFPRLLYRMPGNWQLETGHHALRTVADQAECDAALAEGWALDQYEAIDLYKARLEAEAAELRAAAQAQSAPPAPHPVPAEPTRADMEAQAEALGVKVDRRWSDHTLAAKIAEAKG